MDDLISRQAVMDAMYELCGEGSLKDDPWRDNPHIDSIIDAIEHLPSVTPKQRTGHWIPTRCDMYDCSECGRTYTSFEIGTCDANFCPNCGTKMRESGVGKE